MSFLINGGIPEGDLPVKIPSGAAKIRYTEGGKSYSSAMPDVVAASALVQDAIDGVVADAVSEIGVVVNGIGYLPPVAFASGLNVDSSRFTVTYNGVTYAPVADALPFTTTGTFNSAQWRVVQGVTTSSLAADGGAGLVGFKQAGSGAVTRTVQDKLRDTVSVLDFIPVAEHAAILSGASSYDCAPSIQSAINRAIAIGRGGVYLPTGVYPVGSTINMGRMKLHGDGDGSVIKPLITDGSPVLLFPAGTNFMSLHSFRIDNGLNLADFMSGAVNGQNCIGIKVASSGGTYSARFVMRDIVVRGCKVGFDIDGFIGTLDNVWALACETGLIGAHLNSTRLHMRFEECRKDFAITNSDGIHFDQVITEGGILQSGLLPSTLDGCRGVAFTAPYFEQVRNVPFLIVGGTTECKAVSVNGLTIAMQDNPSSDYDTVPLSFDKLDGLTLSGYFSTGAHHSRYSTTASTKNLIDLSVASSVNNFGPHDASCNLSPVRNHFPNPSFELWFRGWPAVSVSRAAIAKESALVRRGSNAVRLTLSAGQANGAVSWAFNDNYLAVKLRGKRVSCYQWIWIPETADYDPNDLIGQKVQPRIEIYCDGTGSATATSGEHHSVRGAWNLFKVSTTVPADANRIDISVRMTMASGVSVGTEYLVVDSIYLVEGDGQDIHVRNGWIVDSDLTPCRGIGGLATIRGDSVPSDPDMIYEVGDEIRKMTVIAGGSPGWICTTAGPGGTAVFKALPNVAA